MANLAVKAHVKVPPPGEGSSTLKPASPMRCPADLSRLTCCVSNQGKPVPSVIILPIIMSGFVTLIFVEKNILVPVIGILELCRPQFLQPASQGLVILVTQVRVLASAPEIFEE